jgi:hypothetical protein
MKKQTNKTARVTLQGLVGLGAGVRVWLLVVVLRWRTTLTEEERARGKKKTIFLNGHLTDHTPGTGRNYISYCKAILYGNLNQCLLIAVLCIRREGNRSAVWSAPCSTARFGASCNG